MILLNLILSVFAFGILPPMSPEHPGNITNVGTFERIEIDTKRRESFLYLPTGQEGRLAPLVVFGHGQALADKHYRDTLEHLAQKGIAALYVKYDWGFFDVNFQRMARDWSEITLDVLKRFDNRINRNQVIYAGHSKGGYIAANAAGLNDGIVVDSLFLFTPAGYTEELVKNIAPETAMSIFWGEKDRVISKESTIELLNAAPSRLKQFVEVVSYPDEPADHYFPQTLGALFGGPDGVTALHYYGVWKWLVGGAWDLEQKTGKTNPWAYGEKVGSTGQPGLEHKVQRNW